MPGALKISEAASLAIHALIVLGAYPLRSIPVNEIASKINASKDHLAKVMQRLARAGYVTSVRGPKGGFSLIKDAESITLLEIYELIEGPLIIDDCLLNEKICGSGICPLGGALKDVNTKLKEYFESTKISSLTEPFQGV
ncbi:MAG: Rrf2 family transcriptional regulator [bacterium]|nr:Rrf2 family transcriptional regulator [bacterium]